MSGHFSIDDCVLWFDICKTRSVFGIPLLEKSKENPELAKCKNHARPEGLPHTHLIQLSYLETKFWIFVLFSLPVLLHLPNLHRSFQAFIFYLHVSLVISFKPHSSEYHQFAKGLHCYLQSVSLSWFPLGCLLRPSNSVCPKLSSWSIPLSNVLHPVFPF